MKGFMKSKINQYLVFLKKGLLRFCQLVKFSSNYYQTEPLFISPKSKVKEKCCLIYRSGLNRQFAFASFRNYRGFTFMSCDRGRGNCFIKILMTSKCPLSAAKWKAVHPGFIHTLGQKPTFYPEITKNLMFTKCEFCEK